MRNAVSHLQKIVLAYDARIVELREWLMPFAPRQWPGPRAPMVAHLRHRSSAWEMTLVGVHLKSGGSHESVDSPVGKARQLECQTLADWLARSLEKPTDEPPPPPTEAVVLLGDFNAVREHPSLRPLDALLPTWCWPAPVFSKGDGSVVEHEEHWTSWSSQSVIDQVLTSRAATEKASGPPTVYCFDLDPSLDRAPTEAALFLRRRTDLVVALDADRPAVLVENLFRVSDHRPIVIGFDV